MAAEKATSAIDLVYEASYVLLYCERAAVYVPVYTDGAVYNTSPGAAFRARFARRPKGYPMPNGTSWESPQRAR